MNSRNTLIPKEKIRNRRSNDLWKKSETDKMLDLYFSGAKPSRIAAALKRNPKAIKRKVEEFRCNERDRAINYKPVRRFSRKGKRITDNEKRFISSFAERKLPMQALAKVLMRDVKEISSDEEGFRNIVVDQRTVGEGTDILLAHQYLYYCAKRPVVSDLAYDEAKEEEMRFGPSSDILSQPASDRPVDYPAHIRSLAFYLLYKAESKKEEPFKDCLSPDFFQKRKIKA